MTPLSREQSPKNGRTPDANLGVRGFRVKGFNVHQQHLRLRTSIIPKTELMKRLPNKVDFGGLEQCTVLVGQKLK